MGYRLGLAAVAALVLACFAVPAQAVDPTITFKCCVYSATTTRIAPGGSVTIRPDAGVTFADHPLVFVDGVVSKADADATPVTRAFAAAGVYEFYCSIHGSVTPAGHVQGMSGVIRVTTNQLPTASFKASPTGSAVTLDAGASTDDSGITAYRWDFNNDGKDDETDTKPTTTHTFKASATVKLTVVDNNADAVGPESSSTTQKVTIADHSAPKVAIVTKSLHLADLRKGHVKLTFTSSEAGSASATLKAGATTVAKGKMTFSASGRQSLTLKLTHAGAAKLGHAKSVSLSLSLTVRDAAGNHAAKSLSLPHVK
jgi:PKD repeat protein